MRTLMVWIFLLGVVLAAQHQKRLHRICGARLDGYVREICTPIDKTIPCYRHVDWNMKTGREKILEATSRLHKRHHRISHVNLPQAHTKCCEQKCDPDILLKMCCTESEAKSFYKFVQKMEDKSFWINF